jgi:uncharacterized protein YdaL
MRLRRILAARVLASSMAAAAALALVTVPASAADGPTRPPAPNVVQSGLLPAPPAPPTSIPGLLDSITKRIGLPPLLPTIESILSHLPLLDRLLGLGSLGGSSNAAPGADPNQRTLVLYDSTGAYGWLGEAYAVQTANLVSHGSSYVMQPVVDYTAGEMANYSGVAYVGSTYDEPIPTAFLDDVLSGSRPVLWMNDNIWQLAQRSADFSAEYGWTPGYFDFGNRTTVTYKGVALQRDPLAVPSGLLQTNITDPTKATVLATASDPDGNAVPWATKGGNVTYIGEIPFSYTGSNDRYFAAADLVSALADPTGPDRHEALVRLEDVSADADPTQLRQIADYLSANGVPFTVGVIPQYLDPNGYYNDGTPVSTSLAQAPQVVSALRYMQSKGGTLIMHGYTHQYSDVANPYSGVTADDFEFYRAHIDAQDNVVYDGPVAEDSTSWAQNRVTKGKQAFAAAGLAAPTIFEPPHYAASATDYKVFAQNFPTRYDRPLYFGGWCPDGKCGTGTPDYGQAYGQYFPYLVRDIYGSKDIPEDLGNVEPLPYNNHPARLPADILSSAHAASVVRDGVQSFYYHPYLGLDYLPQLVTGLKSMGYQFVSANTVAAG